MSFLTLFTCYTGSHKLSNIIQLLHWKSPHDSCSFKEFWCIKEFYLFMLKKIFLMVLCSSHVSFIQGIEFDIYVTSGKWKLDMYLGFLYFYLVIPDTCIRENNITYLIMVVHWNNFFLSPFSYIITNW